MLLCTSFWWRTLYLFNFIYKGFDSFKFQGYLAEKNCNISRSKKYLNLESGLLKLRHVKNVRNYPFDCHYLTY